MYFRKTYNRLVDLLLALPKGDPVPPPFRLAREFGVSRTLVNSTLGRARAHGLVDPAGKMILSGRRTNGATGRFTIRTIASSEGERVQEKFLRLVRSGRLRPGQYFSESEIAREADSANVTVREALLTLSHSGLIAKQARRSWRVVPLTTDRIAWAAEARLLVECHALRQLLNFSDENPLWQELKVLQERHRVFRETPEPRFEEFYELDREFHSTLYRATANEYLQSFQKVMSFYVLLQSQGARLRPEIYFTACADHLKIIDAILKRDKRQAVALLRDHLERSAKAIRDCVTAADSSTSTSRRHAPARFRDPVRPMAGDQSGAPVTTARSGSK